MKLTGIRLRIDDKATTGSMYVDRIRVIYPTWTSVEDDPSIIIPSGYKLYQNYPNPFNPNTTISYDIPGSAHVSADIYDLFGNKVVNLFSGYQEAGTYSLNFSADQLTSGVYFYRLKADNWVDTKKMLIIK